MLKTIITLLTFAISLLTFGQNNFPLVKDNLQQNWVDSVYSSMSLEQKIGQLFMVEARTNDANNSKHIQNLITKYGIGGLIFMKGTPVKQAELTNKYQSLSSTKLLIAIDGEWGLNMRLSDTYKFPWNMTLGAIANDDLIYQTGKQIAEHCKRIGTHINFGPVIDVNTNPKNPIIGNRSYGSNTNNVASKGVAFMRGMQDQNVLASAKHFPGHGDTDKDSHKTLPVLNHSKEELFRKHIVPYKSLIDASLGSVMVAHLNVPSLDNTGVPSSISKPTITDLLIKQLGFNGLVFTDALNMKGISNSKEPGIAELKAFEAGTDILLMPQDVPRAVELFRKQIKRKQISLSRLETSVKKILAAKYWVGLKNYQAVTTSNLVAELNREQDDELHQNLMNNAVTLVDNKGEIAPLYYDKWNSIAYLNLGEESGNTFYNTLNANYSIRKLSKKNALLEASKHDLIIVGVHKSNANPWKSYKISNSDIQLLSQLKSKTTIVPVIFTSPYSLFKLQKIDFPALIMGYQNSKFGQIAAANALMGNIPFKGKLPVTINDKWHYGLGLNADKLSILDFDIPENVQLDPNVLKNIDSIMNLSVSRRYFPGGVVLVAKESKIVYEKAFGYHTFEEKKKVNETDIYDLASLTKITATLPVLMKMVDEGSLNLDEPLVNSFPFVHNTNKANLLPREILAHQARLTPWIPFYKALLDSVGNRKSEWFMSSDRGNDFLVAEDIYLKREYKDSLYQRILDSDLLPYKRYKYSDLGYILFHKMIEDNYGVPLQDFVEKELYSKIGAHTLGYLPLNRFDKKQIVPSEVDNYFRQQELWGYVNDEGASMLGGVSGHAGLFSNARDLAKMMQLYLNKGRFNGKQLLPAAQIEEFSTHQYAKSRRGVGFDKWKKGNEGSTCGCASLASFGHTGFTGTMAWVDPEEDLIFIFLSNRTHPTRKNRGLIRNDIRAKVQKEIYNAIIR